MAKTTTRSPVRLEQEVVALKRRVLWLEKALRPKPGTARLDKAKTATANSVRELEELSARNKALDEYLEQKQRKRYLESPSTTGLNEPRPATVRTRSDSTLFVASPGR